VGNSTTSTGRLHKKVGARVADKSDADVVLANEVEEALHDPNEAQGDAASVEGSRKRARQEEQQEVALSLHEQELLAAAENAPELDEDEIARFMKRTRDHDDDDLDMDEEHEDELDEEQEDELDKDEGQSDGHNFDNQNDAEERSASLQLSDD
jgi:hypothetical protein